MTELINSGGKTKPVIRDDSCDGPVMENSDIIDGFINNNTMQDNLSALERLNEANEKIFGRLKDTFCMWLIAGLCIVIILFGCGEFICTNLFGFKITTIYQNSFEALKMVLISLVGYSFGASKSKS